MPQPAATVLRATIMQTPERGLVEILEDALVVVGDDGLIAEIVTADDPRHESVEAEAREAGRLEVLGEGRYLLPGFVDLHIHAPQWPQLGKALHLPLEDWLQQYTFPLEARYADLAFANAAYRSLVDALLANGTTTAVYYATVHLEATKALADICQAKGQRALIGKVVMDDPALSPDFYRDPSTEQAVADTAAFIDYANGLAGNGIKLVYPTITPRFIPTCTDAGLKALGDLAAATGAHVQTHCSESDWEHGFVIERTGRTDTRALEAFGLMTRRTVLAHANFICDDDMDAIHACGAGVAHCPLSNHYFSNAVFPLRRALEKGVHVGLGTDISGGHDASIFSNIRHAVASSRALTDGVDASLPAESRGRPGSAIDFIEAFWLATAGGGIVLDLPIGLLAPGYSFDAIVIDTRAADSDLVVWPELDGPEDVFQRIVYSAGRQNIRKVWVAGRAVVDKG